MKFLNLSPKFSDTRKKPPAYKCLNVQAKWYQNVSVIVLIRLLFIVRRDNDESLQGCHTIAGNTDFVLVISNQSTGRLSFGSGSENRDKRVKGV